MVDRNKDYRVEVRKTHEETGFTNAWYPATIITPRTNPLKKRKCNKNKEEEQQNKDNSSTVVETPDVKDFHLSKLRPHWDWVEQQWVISPKQEILYSKFKPGTSVELRHNMVAHAWIPATIIGEKGTDSVVVRYDKNNKAVKITVHLDMIRPQPPQLSNDKDFKLMEKVDAFCESSYWLVGTITSILLQRKYAVNFGTYKNRNEIVFNHSQLRFHLDWVNGQWITNSGEVISTPTKQIPATKDIESPSYSGCEFNVADSEIPCSTNKDDIQIKELLFSATAMNDEEADSPKSNGNVEEFGNSNMLVEFDISGLLSFEEGDQNQNSKTEKRKEQYELQVANSQGNTNEERKSTPFVKRSNVWEMVESFEVFQKLPQKPHFHPLLNEEDDEFEREALALSYMVKFAVLIEKVFNLGKDVSMAEIDYLIAQLFEMGKLGFEVNVVKNNLNEWKMKKVELEELKIQITLHNEKKVKIDEELKILEKKQSLLMSQSAYEEEQVSKLIAEATKINEAFSSIMESSKFCYDQ
ncbi:hypothetical protein G4B88_009040 [Cannabis sativa]|uniref:Agenet domain-containing protein n=1 Tax=Cannabis sativa TaxID=3483 RepID=A0A7J6HPI8_CANSA|nr:hypothetical protein G4B88_009040 [Cannabis sativa]